MRVYFDYNATTPVAPDVAEAMARATRDLFGNPSSVHHFGQQAKAALDEARTSVAASTLNARVENGARSNASALPDASNGETGARATRAVSGAAHVRRLSLLIVTPRRKLRDLRPYSAAPP